MTYLEVFEYDIKFDYDNAGDRKFKKYIAADSVDAARIGIDMILRKLFTNGLVTSQNLRSIEAIPKSDADYEKATFGKFLYDYEKARRKFADFFKD